MSFYQYVLIGIGGAFGAILRVSASKMLPTVLMLHIPSSILIINVIGGLLIGIVNGLQLNFDQKIIHDLKFFCVSGFLGGFTTFSAFTLETAQLLEKEKYCAALAYIILSVVLSLTFFHIGTKISQVWQR
ncbi:MAG: fluoride efflux transporter CrcB [Holosporaceae bacterium]|jgi:CrcB protein|nr:fluoride efflux transporter CrcB [Holosporaceae bacterium]